jgi:hypothetical protein
MDLVPSSAPLAAGTYTRAGFDPAVTFEIGEPDTGRWTAVQSFEGFFDVQQGVGTPDVIAVQFARVVAVFGAGGSAAIALTLAADAIEVIRSNPGLLVVEASPAVMAGREGRGVTVDHVGMAPLSPVIAVPPGPISILPGRRLWLGFFDTTSGLLAILVGGSIARWPEAVTAAQPILASVTIAG